MGNTQEGGEQSWNPLAACFTPAPVKAGGLQRGLLLPDSGRPTALCSSQNLLRSIVYINCLLFQNMFYLKRVSSA